MNVYSLEVGTYAKNIDRKVAERKALLALETPSVQG